MIEDGVMMGFAVEFGVVFVPFEGTGGALVMIAGDMLIDGYSIQ